MLIRDGSLGLQYNKLSQIEFIIFKSPMPFISDDFVAIRFIFSAIARYGIDVTKLRENIISGRYGGQCTTFL
jgi:hypothetical protein